MPRFFAHLISVIGHPLLVMTYMLILLIAINPYAFGVNSLLEKNAILLVITVYVSTFLIPGVGVWMMKPLGLIKSLEMSDKQERIGPYIITGVFYLWILKNFLSGGQVPSLYVQFMLGTTVALFLAFLQNIFTKISIHAVGMGGMAAMILLTSLGWGAGWLKIPVGDGLFTLSLNAVLAIVLIFAGLVGMARLTLSAHTPSDLYKGYLTGIAAQIFASFLI